MSTPGKPTVPLTGGFYGERVNAQEAARIRDQNARQGYTPPNAANPRRTVLGGGDSAHVAPTQLPVRLPEALVLHVELLVREACALPNSTLANGGTGEQEIQVGVLTAYVAAKLREVDVAQLRA